MARSDAIDPIRLCQVGRGSEHEQNDRRGTRNAPVELAPHWPRRGPATFTPRQQDTVPGGCERWDDHTMSGRGNLRIPFAALPPVHSALPIAILVSLPLTASGSCRAKPSFGQNVEIG